jgi:hypothetical protein
VPGGEDSPVGGPAEARPEPATVDRAEVDDGALDYAERLLADNADLNGAVGQ